MYAKDKIICEVFMKLLSSMLMVATIVSAPSFAGNQLRFDSIVNAEIKTEKSAGDEMPAGVTSSLSYTFHGAYDGERTIYNTISQNDEAWLQKKSIFADLIFTYEDPVTVSGFEWYYDEGSPNRSKYPRNVGVQLKNSSGQWESVLTLNQVLQRDLFQTIKIEPVTAKQIRFYFTGRTDNNGYTALQYFKLL